MTPRLNGIDHMRIDAAVHEAENGHYTSFTNLLANGRLITGTVIQTPFSGRHALEK